MMQKIGSFIFVIGLMAIIMNFFNYVPRLLVWIYKWGEGPAWGIKIGLVLIGGLLWFLGNKSHTGAES